MMTACAAVDRWRLSSLSATTSTYMFLKRAMSSTKLNPKNFPRPPLCERTNRHLQIKWKGEVIADTEGSEGAYWVLETFHPPTYYISPSALKVPVDKSNSRSTFCEWKGNAT